ncbi:Na+/H+ antiporter NhaC family protein [Bacilliculturomica massiliensis]|uniref:Na+/H+ antiporter NhaC family protein n=1 Tax=Bacilliculturomica massiliensis TaxID=1917867 RepID=UPI0013EF5199|nr:Na+/H+ antiporter NhaC family protein [Bacilliculturomica massiliensis]
MFETLLAIVPPLLAILLAILTRQVVLSLFIAVYVGAVMLTGGNLWEGLYSTFFDFILPGFEDTDHQRILCLTTLCGGLSLLLERNGGAQAFANVVNKGVGKTKRGAQIITWLGGIFVWFSDSTNPVLVGPVCRGITDKVQVSREKLAYIVDSTTSSVPTLFPISAWGAYIIGLLATFYADYSYNGNPQTDFIAGIPFQFYTIGSIAMVCIIAVTGWDYGPMKKAEDRAATTGQLVRAGADIRKKIETEELPEGARPTVWNMIIPVFVLLFFIFAGLFYTGDIKANGILGALANGSSLRALDTAFLLATISAIIIGMITKVFTFKKSLRIFMDGCSGMMEVLMILMLAWGIGSVCAACGTADWIVNACQGFLTPTTMCVIVFLAACLTSFSTGSSWSVFAIFIPIACSLAVSIDAPIGMAIGVVLSGGIFGDHCSPISDTTVMSSMGSSCDHIDHVSTQLPYALTVAGSSLVGYIVCGLLQGGAFVGLAITLVLICVVSFLLNKHVGRGRDAKTTA